VQEKENVKLKIKPRPTKFLVNKLLDNEFQFNTISAKAAVVVADSSNKKTSFKTHLRIKKDSIIWMSITPLLGIEVARVLITQDSVKLMNRAKSEYFVGDFDYINNLFGADLDYQMLEALLIGNSLDFEMNDKVRSSVDRKKDLYYLSTEKKRRIKKELKKDKDKIKEQSQTLWLNPINFRINELLLSSPQSEKTLKGVYSDYREIDTQLLPYKMNFSLESKTKVVIDVSYNKFTSGKSLSFSFKIPSKYEQIKQ
jgi:hypothetical protein